MVGEPFQSTTIGAQLWHPNSSGRPSLSTTAEAEPQSGASGVPVLSIRTTPAPMLASCVSR